MKKNTLPRLKQKYIDEVVPQMMKDFNYKNKMQVPKLTKIVVNMGVGEAIEDVKILDSAANELSLICGQRPVITRAKKAISNFKIKAGLPIGCKVTLRRNIMYEFLDRLINVALPRIRDFRGVSATSFDDNGNYNLGLKEQVIFPEIDYDKIQRTQGMNISIGIAAKSKEESFALLKLLGMPFQMKT